MTRKLSQKDIAETLRAAKAVFGAFVDSTTAPPPPPPPPPGLTEYAGSLMAETDPAVRSLLFRLYQCVPRAPMALAAATQLAGGFGAIVILSGFLRGPEWLLLTVRIPRELNTAQLSGILALAGFQTVLVSQGRVGFDEWVWYVPS